MVCATRHRWFLSSRRYSDVSLTLFIVRNASCFFLFFTHFHYFCSIWDSGSHLFKRVHMCMYLFYYKAYKIILKGVKVRGWGSGNLKNQNSPSYTTFPDCKMFSWEVTTHRGHRHDHILSVVDQAVLWGLFFATMHLLSKNKCWIGGEKDWR